MLYLALTSPEETLAWAEADNKAWAERAAAAFTAATARGQEPPAEHDS